MAVLARRTWATIRDEAILRLGNITATGFSGRVEHWCRAAYEDLATTFHHFELDDVDTSLTCSTSANEVTLPSTCFIVVGVRLKNVGGASVKGPLTVEDFHTVARQYLGSTPGVPTRCARFKDKLYFDKKPDAAYPIELFQYKKPTAPDFTTPTSPELAPDVDEHILEAVLRKAWPSIARPDLGQLNRQLLDEWLQQQVRPALVVDALGDLPERENSNRHLGGKQS